MVLDEEVLGPCRPEEWCQQGPGGQHEVETENLDLTRELESGRWRGSRGAQDEHLGLNQSSWTWTLDISGLF